MTYKLMYFNNRLKQWRQSLFGAANFDLEDGFSTKLSEANFVVGLYVMDIKRNIFITIIVEGDYMIVNLNTGLWDWFFNGCASNLYIIDDALIKIKTDKLKDEFA